MKKVGVLGSINTDFVTMARVLPVEGETVKGTSFSVQYGGKGANKAVALKRLGLQVDMFGAVGDDDFSKRCVANLDREKIETKHIKKFRNQMGGVANVASSDKTNMIVVVPGANQLLESSYVEKLANEVKTCDLVVADLEVPQPIVVKMSEICKENKVKFVINPSPVMKFTKKLLSNSDYIVVNEVEVKNLPGYKNDKQVLELYKGRLILTMGKLGTYFYDGECVKRIAAEKTTVVDTTGAGDAFLGGFIYSILENKTLEESVKFANACAACKISKLGAQAGMPKLSEVKKFLKI